MNKPIKIIGALILSALIIYSATMIVVRLKMTAMAYEFDELKASERSMKEEQARLRALISEKLSPDKMFLEDFSEPNPEQVVVIP